MTVSSELPKHSSGLQQNLRAGKHRFRALVAHHHNGFIDADPTHLFHFVIVVGFAFFVIRFAWGYPLLLCVLATGFFLLIDLAFFSSAMLK